MKAARAFRDLALTQPSLLDDEGDTGQPGPSALRSDGRPRSKRAGTSRAERRTKSLRMQSIGKRRYIDAGKPIALEVAKRDGQVTAETFRATAAELKKLPPTYGEQRALSWIPVMFAELVRDGALRKRRRADGSVVKSWNGQRNEQVIYELMPAGNR